MNIKVFLLVVLLVAALFFWILPKTKLSGKMKMSVTLFYVVNVIGIVFGVLGLILTFLMQDLIMNKHYFELILLPVFFIYLYVGMLFKVKGGDELFDEKQNWNMTQAAALTFPATIVAVFFIYAMYKEGILTGNVFFPVFLFFSLAVYSAGSIYYFRKN
ncbi:MAG: hypothetical protein GXO77_11740 [Calditrichaeota bacterium]|nr:hypothetical protein [Calditrichota bacterium]